MNQSFSDNGVCRTAPATPGLVTIFEVFLELLHEDSSLNISQNFVSTLK